MNPAATYTQNAGGYWNVRVYDWALAIQQAQAKIASNKKP